MPMKHFNRGWAVGLDRTFRDMAPVSRPQAPPLVNGIGITFEGGALPLQDLATRIMPQWSRLRSPRGQCESCLIQVRPDRIRLTLTGLAQPLEIVTPVKEGYSPLSVLSAVKRSLDKAERHIRRSKQSTPTP